MKKAIQFGAGNIGRGFIGALLSQAGYEVVFADIDQQIVDLINREGHYILHIVDVIRGREEIANIRAVNAADGQALAEEMLDAELVTTAVGLGTLHLVAPTIAGGIALRLEKGVYETMNVIACENGIMASTRLMEEVLRYLDATQTEYVRQWVGFPNCSVDRIVPPLRGENPLDVYAERFYEWDVERSAVKGELYVPGMNLVGDLPAYQERKLFTLNTGHAITSYLGWLCGYRTVHRSITDEKIYDTVLGAMRESGMALVRRYNFSRERQLGYIDRVIKRFRNPWLEDELARVCREPLRKLAHNDRFVQPILAARSYGIDTTRLLTGMAAALRYDNPDDEQSRRMQEMIASEGLRRAVARITGIREDEPLMDDLVAAYDTVREEFPLPLLQR